MGDSVFRFYQLPTALMMDRAYSGLSAEGKLLYAVLLGRVGLSAKNGWRDEQGKTFVHCSNREICGLFHCGHNKATRLLRELEEEFHLICRKRRGLGHPDRIYVLLPESEPEEPVESPVDNVEKPVENLCTAVENSPSAPTVPRKEGVQSAQNRRSRVPKTGILECPKGATNKIDLSNIDSSQIYPSILTGMEGMDGDERRDYFSSNDGILEELRERWGYSALLDSYQKATLDGIFLLGSDILRSRAETIRISGEPIPTREVQQRLRSLDFTHIDYVLSCVRQSRSTVHNIRGYLLAALYRAPATVDAYYDQLLAKNEGG